MLVNNEFGQNYAAEQFRRSRHPIRTIIKRLYLDNILRDVRGPTVDFGCGAGQLLARLPHGSVGLEVNPYLVEELAKAGLNVTLYDPDADQFAFSNLPNKAFTTLVMAHVLEHFTDAAQVLRQLLRSCRRLGVERVILVLPTTRGFASDNTHKTFVDFGYLQNHGLLHCEGFAVAKTTYFPGNCKAIGRFFTYHEFKVVYDFQN